MTTSRQRADVLNRLCIAAACALVAALAIPASLASAQLPDFLQVGWRLTWHAGDSQLSGARMVPDPEGAFERNNQRHRIEGTQGGGGVGLIQLNILTAGLDSLVADVRYFLNTDLQTGAHRASGNDVVLGSQSSLGEYWVSPITLAALAPGFDGRTRVTHGTMSFGGQQLNVVSIATPGQGSYVSDTYDLGSGLLLFSGTMHSSAGTRIADDNGQITDFTGSVTYSHKQFLGVRPVSVPWALEAPPAWASAGSVNYYQGENRPEYNQSTGLPPLAGQQLSVAQAFDSTVGNALLGRQVVQSATAPGLPPSESTASRAFGSAMLDGLWVPPQAFGRLQPQQLLDQDPYTGQATYFAGVVDNLGVIVVQGGADYLEHYYDLASGLLTFVRYRVQAAGVGTQVTEMSWVGRQ